MGLIRASFRKVPKGGAGGKKMYGEMLEGETPQYAEGRSNLGESMGIPPGNLFEIRR